MAIQDTIIQALQASHEAHQAGLAALVASQTAHHEALGTIETLQKDKASLEARVAELEAQVAYLQSESVKIVDPETVNPLLDWLSRAVAATNSAIHPGSVPPEGPAAAATAQSEQHPGAEDAVGEPAAEVHASEVHASEVHASDVHASNAPAPDAEPVHDEHVPSETPVTPDAEPAIAEEPVEPEPLVSTLLEEASAASDLHKAAEPHVFEEAAVAAAPHAVAEPDAPHGFASQIQAVVLHFEDAEIGTDTPDTAAKPVHAAETHEHAAMEKQG